MPLFKGFSTKTSRLKIVDEELVKQDLMNELSTRKTERVMRPEYGTIIYDLLMDQYTEDITDLIVEDVTRIVNKDPRVKLSDINVTEAEHAVIVKVSLIYIKLNSPDVLYIEYTKDNL